jgi:Undecaprenyl-phosphate glucose phosphotransferase
MHIASPLFEALPMKPDAPFLQNAAKLPLADLVDAPERRATRDEVLANLPKTSFIPPKLFSGAAHLLDIILLATAGVLLANYFPGFARIDSLSTYFGAVAFAALMMFALFEVAGLYKLNVLLAPMRKLPVLVACWTTVFGLVLSAVFLLKLSDLVSRLWLVGFGLVALFFVIFGRFLFARAMRKFNTKGQLNKRAVLVGDGEPASRVISVLEKSSDSGITLIGIFDDRGTERVGDVSHGLARLGTIDDLIDFVRSTRIDTLIVTLPIPAEERLLQILNRLWVLPVDIRLSANGQKLHYRPRAYSYIGNLPCLDVYDKPLGEWGPHLKSLSDKVMASIALVVLAPLMAAIALAIKLDSKGAVIFKQKRFGFNNEMIEIYKFRSMYQDRTDVEALKLVSKGDPRVTRVGRFIRKSSIDELPQLFNVLKGDLSLVGPRPHPTKAKAGEALYENVVASYFARHKVKPGITGWAQINGWRGETDTAEKIERRVEHDLYYIDNWSLTFDLYILLRTPWALLNTDNAF